MISAIGVRNVVENQVDFTNIPQPDHCRRHSGLRPGLQLAWAASRLPIGGVNINLSGLAIAAIVGILLNAILPGNDYEFDEGSNEPESASLRV